MRTFSQLLREKEIQIVVCPRRRCVRPYCFVAQPGQEAHRDHYHRYDLAPFHDLCRVMSNAAASADTLPRS